LRTFADRLAPIFGQRLGYTSNVWMKRHLGHDQGFTEYWEVWDPPAELDGVLTNDAQAVTLAAAWMKERADDRFLAYLHLMKPHTPYDPPMPYFSRFAEREIDPTVGTHEFIQSIRGQRPDEATVRDVVALYDANLAYADAMIGELISELEAAGVWERTVFILMSDHGQSLYEFGHSHGHGGNVFEATVNVPLFIRIPGLPELAGRRVDVPVELVDLVPTLLDLTGIAVPADSLAGRSLLPMLAGMPTDDKQPRLIHSRTNRLMPPVFSLTRGRFKLTAETVSRQTTRYGLFDLESDPGEATDLLREQPDHPEGTALRLLMEAWLNSGTREGATSSGVEFDVFDPEEVERLRSLGYVN
jgi:arylsulfatase A-like enzyme